MGLALVVGVISAMDILTTMDTSDYLWIGAWHFSWYKIFGWLLCMSSGSGIIGGEIIRV